MFNGTVATGGIPVDLHYYTLKNDRSEAMGNQTRANNNNLTIQIKHFVASFL